MAHYGAGFELPARHMAYEIRVERHYGEFVALVNEFPSLSWIAATESGARRGMQELLREVLEDMEGDK